MVEYLALIRKETGTSFGVDFPDFPGCVSGGETLGEALQNAAGALAVHIEGMALDGELLPEPSDLETVMADRHNRGTVAVLVPAPPIKGQVKRINITLDEYLIEAIDRTATDQGLTRSGFIATTARAVLASLEPTAVTGRGNDKVTRKSRTPTRSTARKSAGRAA